MTVQFLIANHPTPEAAPATLASPQLGLVVKANSRLSTGFSMTDHNYSIDSLRNPKIYVNVIPFFQFYYRFSTFHNVRAEVCIVHDMKGSSDFLCRVC